MDKYSKYVLLMGWSAQELVRRRWVSSSAIASVLIFQIAGSIITTSPFLDSVFSQMYAEGEDSVIKKEEKVLPEVDLVVVQQVINYSFEIIAANFTDISLTGNNTNIDQDDTSIEVPIGFNLTFYENEYDSVFISSNGFLTFDSDGSGTFGNDDIPTVFLPNNLIAPFWDDLDPAVGGSILFEKIGVAPIRTFIVQWHNVPPFNGTDGYKFQAKLHESSNNVEFQYADVISNGGSNGTSATVGVEDILGTRGTQSSFNSASLFDGLGLLFKPTDFSFALSADPNVIEIDSGNNATSVITVELIDGSPELVSLECVSPPSGVSCSFDPVSVTPPSSSVLTISTSTEAFEGNVLLMIQGSAGGITRTTLIDLIIISLAEIHGIKFADLNGNGIRDPGESGIPDWTIFLCCPDGEVISTTTDDEGRYSFTALDPFSCYFVFEEFRADFVKSAPMFFSHQVCFFFSPEIISTGNNFGNMPFSPGEIHGTKFADLNGNGARDTGEPGLADWGIRLVTHDPFGDMIIMKTKTNELGEYSFTNVTFGLHTIMEIPLEGYNQTLPQPGDFSWTDDLYPFVVTAESISSESLSNDQTEWRGVVNRSNATSVVEVTDLIIPAAIETFEDPVGDTFGSFSSGGSKLDITSVGAHYEDHNLVITMTFADPLPPPDLFGTIPIGGFIDIDGDRDASTGALSFQSVYGAPPSSGLGDEFFIDLFSVFDGTVPVVAPLGFNFFSIMEFAPITFSEDSFSIVLDECIFGGQHFNYGAVVGKFNEFATDEVANDRVLKSTGSPSCTNPPRFVPIIRSGEVVNSIDFGNKPKLEAPVANAGGPYFGDEGDPVAFNSSGSFDPDGSIVAYLWFFGDGTNTTHSNPNPTHVYKDNGVYTVTLRVFDDGDGHDTDTTTATINNVAPSVDAGPDLLGFVGQIISFLGSFIDPGSADTHTVAWDFGDISISELAEEHAYSAPGVYTATLTVIDDDGGIGNDTLTVTIGQLFCGKTIDQFPNIINGTENDDTLIGTSANELIRGFGGNDRIEGRGSHDCLIGGDGNDTIFGNGGNDMIEGEDGDDTIGGGGGHDMILGGKGNDSIKGNAGNDTMDGGDDSDTCKGGTGTNTKNNCEA